VTEDLNDLTTEELRRRAFDKAQSAHDVHFFWDLAKHLSGSHSLATEDGSGGGITGSLADLVDLARELMGKGFGDDEPLVRARFLDYLRA
jgi:hypothetical protein